MKTAALIGPALDWAVAKCEEYPTVWVSHDKEQVFVARSAKKNATHFWWTPSSNWHQGGPIIEREAIAVLPDVLGAPWAAASEEANHRADRLLIAAMRCYVASKLGDEIDLPEELK